jgi:hypothetical protein
MSGVDHSLIHCLMADVLPMCQMFDWNHVRKAVWTAADQWKFGSPAAA